MKDITVGFQKRNSLLVWITCLCACCIFSCLPEKKEKASGGNFELDLDLSDPTNRLIYNWQDRVNPDSLVPFLSSNSARKRFIAAMAFGSMPDTAFIPELALLLEDNDLSVRVAAAYALGQTGHIQAERHLLSHWIDNDQTPGFAVLNSMIFESVGKCGSAASLRHMAEMDKLVSTDTLMLLGQSRGIFRFLLRGLHHPEGTKRMLMHLEDKLIPITVKRVAASYFARLPRKEADPYLDRLIKVYKDQDDLAVQHSVLSGIAQCTGKDARTFLFQVASGKKSDPILVSGAMRGLYAFADDEVEQLMDQMLFADNFPHQEIAGRYFLEYGAEARAMYYFNRSRNLSENDFAAKYQLVAAALKHMPLYYRAQRDSINASLQFDLGQTKNIAIASAIVRAMAFDFANMVPLKNIMYSDQAEAVRSAAALALGQLAAQSQFDAFFKSYAPESRAFIAKYLGLAASDHTSFMVGPAAQALIDAGPATRLYLRDTFSWQTLLSNLVLPRQNEDYDLIVQLHKLMFPDSTTLNPRKFVFNNPVDWDAFAELPAKPKAVIATNKGMIEIELYKDLCPATVVHFVKLSKSGYYKERLFHRVVPNFVIQGGCNRGDGYGSLDMSIRSETPPLYFDRPGLIGMASAGRHTESQQFFITHMPAMHLDGKYTLFGEVVKGMDVVYKIKPGDWIESIVIL